MAPREVSLVAATLVIALAAVLGGAFYPGPRIVIGVLIAVTLGWSAAAARGWLCAEEWAVLAFVGWGVAAAVGSASTPLAARETVVVWFIAWGLWLFARRAGEKSVRLGSIALASTAAILALGVMLEAAGAGMIRVGGLLENPNVTASLLVAAIPVLWIIGTRPRWIFVAGGAVLLGLVVTGSRAGLLALLLAGAVVLPRGRLLIRNICMVFDAYLDAKQGPVGFSKVI